MKKKIIFLTLFFCLVLLIVGCTKAPDQVISKSENKKDPNSDLTQDQKDMLLKQTGKIVCKLGSSPCEIISYNNDKLVLKIISGFPTDIMLKEITYTKIDNSVTCSLVFPENSVLTSGAVSKEYQIQCNGNPIEVIPKEGEVYLNVGNFKLKYKDLQKGTDETVDSKLMRYRELK